MKRRVFPLILTLCLTIFTACQTDSQKVTTNQDRINYLSDFGWQVSETPISIQELVIPEDVGEINAEYTSLQSDQGFDLKKYAGKSVERYTYEVLNYPTGEVAQANLLIYNSIVIGGEVLSPELDGFLHGLAMPQDVQTSSEQTAIRDPLLGNTQDQTDTSDSSTSDYFATARLNRQQARDSALASLQDAAAQDDADDALKEQINDKIQTMADYTVTEAQIENLVISKGYVDCVAFIGEDTLSVAVAAPEGGLTEADIAKIVDVARQVGGFSADQISIIEVE